MRFKHILEIIIFIQLIIVNNDLNFLFINTCSYSLIEIKKYYKQYKKISELINRHIILYHIMNRKNINISGNVLFIEHNNEYDDIAFLLPLYSIIIKTKIVIICNEDAINSFPISKNYICKTIRYENFNNCVVFNVEFLNQLHLHSNIFRLCKFANVVNYLKNNALILYNNSVCKKEIYTLNYSIVTTIYKRKNINYQLHYYKFQLLPPKHVIIVHDRCFIEFNISNISNSIIYVHTVNFKAGYYFRYLISLLSPEEDIIIYDDDWFPVNRSSHLRWIEQIYKKNNSIISHHIGRRNGVTWCATPLIVHRKWLYLIWLNKIYNENVAEDGHLSFSLQLLCDIKCSKKIMKGLIYKTDNLSSSVHLITSILWNNYSLYVKAIQKSSYVSSIRNKYNIY